MIVVAACRAARRSAATCRAAARHRRRRSARRGTAGRDRAPAPWRSSPGASSRPKARGSASSRLSHRLSDCAALPRSAPRRAGSRTCRANRRTARHTFSNMSKPSSCGTSPIRARALRQLRRKILAERRDRAAGGPHQPADRADQRGLARAVGPEQRENLALADRQIDTVERLRAALVGFGQAANVENRFSQGTWSCGRNASWSRAASSEESP